MLKHAWLAALGAVLLAGSSGQAQSRRSGPLFFGGVDPTSLVNRPIDASTANVPIATPGRRRSNFKLLDFMPKISLPGTKPIIGRSSFPTQSQLPGNGYLRDFGFRPGTPVRP